MKAIDPGGLLTLRPSEFSRIRAFAYQTFGLDLRPGKESLVVSRLGQRLRDSGYRSFDEYLERVASDREGLLRTDFIDALTTNHTSFFREPAHFKYLKEAIFPQWQNRRTVAIWSAACSSGEEPYSVAMQIHDYFGPVNSGRFQITATDISKRMLEHARLGVYAEDRLDGTPKEDRRKHWLRGQEKWAGHFRLKKHIRDMVQFDSVNLVEKSALGSFALILCRNVMIYFDRATQQNVVDGLLEHLEPGGYLFIGHSESLNGVQHSLEYVQPAIYRKSKLPAKERNS
jgi:chemotaxis protein methyltransferase CheR